MFSHLLITLRLRYRNRKYKYNYNNYTIIYIDVFK